MVPHFQRELEKLNARVLEMGCLVTGAIRRAIRAFLESDPAQARQVEVDDRGIDALENLIEEECLKMLALYQPVARDLRYLCTVLKVNNDLERMADHARNIAQEVLRAAEKPGAEAAPPAHPATSSLREEMEAVGRLLGEALQAFTTCDPRLARRILGEDAQVDRRYQRVVEESLARMKELPAEVASRYRDIVAASNLERIGDLCKNIAEEIIYLVEGRIVRHRAPEDLLRAAPSASAGLSPVHLDAMLESDPLEESLDH